MEDVSKKISSTLKRLRKIRKWSLDRTAKRTGVSKAMLGQIERKESSPTINTLLKIANGFNTSFESFLYEKEIPRKQKRREIQIKDPSKERLRITELFPYEEDFKFETFLVDLLPGCEQLSLPHQIGVVEHIVVTYGEMEVLIKDRWVKLSQNEGIAFDASEMHGYRNTTTKVASFHNIIHYSNPKVLPE